MKKIFATVSSDFLAFAIWITIEMLATVNFNFIPEWALEKREKEKSQKMPQYNISLSLGMAAYGINLRLVLYR